MAIKKTNDRYRDSLFRTIFGEDKECAMALYNAVNGTDYTDCENLQIVTLKDALYIGRKNDAAYIFHDLLSVFEQQSSYNPNMPLRGLGYISDSYEEYIAEAFDDPGIIYTGKQMRIPTPRYYVLYNGPDTEMKDHEMRLSDAYDGDGDIEVIAHLININKEKNNKLLEMCKPLRDYAELVYRVRKNKAEFGDNQKAVAVAVDSCIKDGIFADILRKEMAKVTSMLIRGLTDEELQRLRDKEQEELRQGKEEVKQMTEEAKQMTEEAKQMTEEAQQMMGEAQQMMEEATQMMGEATQMMEEAKQMTGEARQVIEEANQRMGEANQVMEEAKQMTGEARQLIEENKQLREELRAMHESLRKG